MENQPELDGARLSGTVWRFFVSETALLCPYLILLPDGRIGNHRAHNEHSWSVHDGALVFWDSRGVRTSVFHPVQTEDGYLRLSGFHQSATPVRLEQIPAIDRLADAADGPEISANRPRTGRRNLVIVRANENSLHNSWARDIADEDRSWDLFVSFYGREEVFVRDAYAEYQALQNKTHKFDSAWLTMHRDSPLWEYDYVAFPDDDLDMKWSDLNVLFSVCREYGLSLAQPSLLPGGFNHYKELEQNRNYVLRYVSMVETIMPVFSREALKICAPTFALNRLGIGTDFAWSRLVGTPSTNIAVIDKMGVVHTRPIAGGYDFNAEIANGHRIANMFSTSEHFWVTTYGGIYAEPMPLSSFNSLMNIIKRWPT